VAAAHRHTVKTPTRAPADDTRRSDAALFAADQFHASAAGHALFAETVAPAFERAYVMARDVPGAGVGD
jgi:lysophospholipase L1-like esterase